jgi:short-subunit dehydrogenase
MKGTLNGNGAVVTGASNGTGANFAERVRLNQGKVRSNLKSQYDLIVCGSGLRKGLLYDLV